MSQRVAVTVTLVVAVLTLGTLDTVIRLVGPRLGDPLPYGLDPPLEWLEPEYQRLVADMDSLDAEGIAMDLVLVGTSMVMFDLKVQTLQDGLSSSSRVGNAGAPDATAAIVRRWLVEEVVPRVHPVRVIWGMSSLDFNSSRDRLDAYEATRPVSTGVAGELDRRLGSISALSRYRELLRRPGPLLDVFRMRPDPDTPSDWRPLDSVILPETSRSPEVLAQLTDFLANFSIYGPEEEAIEETKSDLDDLGIDLVVVLMPVPSEYIAAHPGGAAQFAEWRRWVTGEAHRLGIPLLDHSQSLPDTAFPDYTHLGSEGADRLSHLVVDDLLLLGW